MASELVERRAVRVLLLVGFAVLMVVTYTPDDHEHLPVIVYCIVLVAVGGIAEVVRPGIAQEWQYDHPRAGPLAAGGVLAGLGLVGGESVAFVGSLAAAGVLAALLARPGLRRRVERERQRSADGGRRST